MKESLTKTQSKRKGNTMNAKNAKFQKMDKLFYPKSVAVIGASNKPGSVGNEIMKRLISFKFPGQIYPISLKEKEIEGLACYASVLDIKKNIDLVIIAVPNSVVLNVIDECHSAKISAAVVISAGFKEVGGSGIELENELVRKAKKYEMLIVGPNCLGVINTKSCLNATFAPLNPLAGSIGFASQSGALGSGIINILPQISLGIGQFVSLGNSAVLTAEDFLEYWEQDNNIKLIMLYVESIKNLQNFKKICSRVTKTKPILIIKSGRSSVGAKATASHTGSLAGDDITISAFIASSGVIRELNLRDFISTAQVLSTCSMPQGEKLAIITNAGGPGIISADCAEDEGIQLAVLTDETKIKLKKFLSSQASINNPVDVVASASLEQVTNAAEVLLKASEVDILLVIYLYITKKNDVALTLELERLRKKYPNKAIVAMFMTTADFAENLRQEKKQLNQKDTSLNIPILNYPSDAIHGIKRLIERQKLLNGTKKESLNFTADKKRVADIIANAQMRGITKISTLESLEIFNAYNLPVVKFGSAKTFIQAKKIAKNIGYPVTIKISSDTISHKTDVGGVVTNIKDEKMLKVEWGNLTKRLQEVGIADQINNIVIMEQVKNSQRELVAGIATKENIGKLAMFGIGGIFIETLREVAFSPCPLTPTDADALINSTKAKDLLGNVRGHLPADLKIMKEILIKLSQLVVDFPQIKEVDANPIMISKQGEIFLVDARVII